MSFQIECKCWLLQAESLVTVFYFVVVIFSVHLLVFESIYLLEHFSLFPLNQHESSWRVGAPGPPLPQTFAVSNRHVGGTQGLFTALLAEPRGPQPSHATAHPFQTESVKSMAKPQFLHLKTECVRCDDCVCRSPVVKGATCICVNACWNGMCLGTGHSYWPLGTR